jgi:hypothetical protein
MISRRGLITGLISFAVAPAIVKIENIMPVKVIKTYTVDEYYEQIVVPMLDDHYKKIASQLANDVLYGTNYTGLNIQANWDKGISFSLVDLLKDDE